MDSGAGGERGAPGDPVLLFSLTRHSSMPLPSPMPPLGAPASCRLFAWGQRSRRPLQRLSTFPSVRRLFHPQAKSRQDAGAPSGGMGGGDCVGEGGGCITARRLGSSSRSGPRGSAPRAGSTSTCRRTRRPPSRSASATASRSFWWSAPGPCTRTGTSSTARRTGSGSPRRCRRGIWRFRGRLACQDNPVKSGTPFAL
jgi:hypothetical protein